MAKRERDTERGRGKAERERKNETESEVLFSLSCRFLFCVVFSLLSFSLSTEMSSSQRNDAHMTYRVAKTQRMPQIAGHFSQKSH